MDHHQARQTDARVEICDEPVDGLGSGDVDPGGPGVRDIEAERAPIPPDPTRFECLRDLGELRDVRPEPEAAPSGVLEDDLRALRAVVDLPDDQGEAAGD